LQLSLFANRYRWDSQKLSYKWFEFSMEEVPMAWLKMEVTVSLPPLSLDSRVITSESNTLFCSSCSFYRSTIAIEPLPSIADMCVPIMLAILQLF
jgi:hypothetical protein